MDWTFHLLLFDRGTVIDDATVVVGTSLESAAEELRRHLVEIWPDEDWPEDSHDLMELLNNDGERKGKRVRYVALDLGQALAHEYGGERPKVGLIPPQTWQRAMDSFREALDDARKRIRAERRSTL